MSNTFAQNTSKEELSQKILAIYSSRALPYLVEMTNKPIKRRDEPERELTKEEKRLHEMTQRVRINTYKLYMEDIAKEILKSNQNQEKALLVSVIDAKYKNAFRLLPDKFYEEIHLKVDKL